MKSFIITIDTEGDNLWNYEKGSLIRTENVNFIPRFQELCNKYGFKPVWLTNYEMIMSDDYVNYIKGPLAKGQCEVGIHVHAWNNPPMHQLEAKYSGNPYLIEDVHDLNAIRFYPTKNFKLAKTINLGVYPYNTGKGWMPIDNFSGTLDGDGYKILNLYVNRPAQDNCGLFARIFENTNVTLQVKNVFCLL